MGHRSYADMVKNKHPLSSDRYDDKILQMIMKLQGAVTDMQKQMSLLEERISLLEQDAFERHIEPMEENANSNTDSTNSTCTTVHNQGPENNKDIRITQNQLSEKLNQMG